MNENIDKTTPKIKDLFIRKIISSKELESFKFLWLLLIRQQSKNLLRNTFILSRKFINKKR